MRKVVSAELKKFLTSTKRAEKAQARLVMEKVVGRVQDPASRPASTRETQRRKNALESSALPAKLADCRATDNERTELFIVEGDSALGTAKLARNSEFQALLPIRGKILNVQKASVGDMLKNAECASIIQVVGAGSGRTFDLEARPLRPDHLHGRRRLRRRPHPLPAGDPVLQVHARPDRAAAGSSPPCRRCTGSSSPTPRRGWRSTSTPTPTTSCSGSSPSWRRRASRWKDPVQRYKGLGEMDANQLAETTMDPRHRTLRRITVDDAEAAAQVFELLMGSDVAPRKEFLVQGAYEVDVETLWTPDRADLTKPRAGSPVAGRRGVRFPA